MTDTLNQHQKTEAALKQKRLEQALRANLHRRKSQQRGRNAPIPPRTEPPRQEPRMQEPSQKDDNNG